jgi:hypothetical protein
MLHNKIDSLAKDVQPVFREFLKRCETAGLWVTISETKRDIEVQAVYALRGRTDGSKIATEALQILGEKLAWRFSEHETKHPVTWTLKSNHLDGHAMDIRVYNDDGKAIWDGNHIYWKRALQIARDLGISCGADWARPDYPHLEKR